MKPWYLGATAANACQRGWERAGRQADMAVAVKTVEQGFLAPLSVIVSQRPNSTGRRQKMHEKQRNDRRIQKTRTLLLEALGALIHEKAYDSIVVKEILHRANVGRSTFYVHFRETRHCREHRRTPTRAGAQSR
jgi:hypothetical protein